MKLKTLTDGNTIKFEFESGDGTRYDLIAFMDNGVCTHFGINHNGDGVSLHIMPVGMFDHPGYVSEKLDVDQFTGVVICWFFDYYIMDGNKYVYTHTQVESLNKRLRANNCTEI